jgi:hypothetical protein
MEVHDDEKGQPKRADDPGTPEVEGRELEREDRAGERGSGRKFEDSGGEADLVSGPASASLDFPVQSPLFHAQHADRYQRQALIDAYEKSFGCRLIVMTDAIFPYSVTFFEELLVGADHDRDLHLLLDSPGGDGETAVRLVRAAQARCSELTVLVPNQAKSAGTLFVMGAHHILMGPTSDLGPVDPQFQIPERGLYSAKDLIAAVENAEKSIAANPDSYPLHVSLLADVTAVMVQQSRSALARTTDLVKEALRSNPDRSEAEINRLAEALKEPLIDLPRDHGAVFGASDASRIGLPVIEADPRDDQWKLIWRLWTKYFALGPSHVYEGRYVSQIWPLDFTA